MQFALVGGAAALTHYATAMLCVYVLAQNEYAANVIGFLVAFSVSYLGQSLWTFADKNTPRQHALPRYFLTSLTGFGINTVFLYMALYINLPYPLALLLAIAGSACFVYIISSTWVFRHHGN